MERDFFEQLGSLAGAITAHDLSTASRVLALIADSPDQTATLAPDRLLELKRGLELERMSDDEARALPLHIERLQQLSKSRPSPIEVLVEVDATAARLLAMGHFEQAIIVFEIADGLARTIGDPDGAATVARLRELAKALRLAGRTDEAAKREEQAADIEARFGSRERRSTYESLPGTRTDTDGDCVVDVFFQTHRNVVGRSNPYEFFGGMRSLTVSHGIATVSVPKARDKGEFPVLPRWRRKAGTRSDDCFHLKQIETMSEQTPWLRRLRQDISGSDKREALLFIHGFNVSFWEAMLRAAQLGADLEIDGAVAAYSWPSRGRLLHYDTDQNQVIDGHISAVADMIIDLMITAKAERIYLIAHSLGSRFLMMALAEVELRAQRGEVPVEALSALKEIIFAAPDVDTADFTSRIGKLSAISARVTTYCSQNDLALWWGWAFRHRYPRAGHSPDDLAATSIDTIDTTLAVADVLGHGDYASTALNDVLASVWLGLPPQCRPGVEASNANGSGVWVCRPEYVDGPQGVALRAALTIARRTGSLAAAESTIDAKQRVVGMPFEDTVWLASVRAELTSMRSCSEHHGGARTQPHPT